MANIDTLIAAADASADAAIARAIADHTTLTAEVARLQAIIDSGTATPAQEAALAARQAKLDALDPTNPATLKA